MSPTPGFAAVRLTNVQRWPNTERPGPSWVRALSPTWKWQSKEQLKPRFSWHLEPQGCGNQRLPQFKRMEAKNRWVFQVPNLLFQGAKLSFEPWGKNSWKHREPLFLFGEFMTYDICRFVLNFSKKMFPANPDVDLFEVFGVFSGLHFTFLLTRLFFFRLALVPHHQGFLTLTPDQQEV